MSTMYIKYKNHPELVLDINNTEITNQWIELIKNNLCDSLPVYRDRVRYNVEYMFELAHQARAAFNWEWTVPEYDLAYTTILHKDLERLLGHTGFENVSEQHDHLLMEIHYCLHIIQNPETIGTRNGAFQLEWFNDSGFDLPMSFAFNSKKQFGDVELLNPFVGHGPVQIFQENDYTEIAQTCKFHNFVKAGLVISTYNHSVEHNKILNYFVQHAPDFVKKHGAEKIQHYTGFPKIGRVINLEDFRQLLKCSDIIEIESVRFSD
jgi:hypothetical protein